MSHEDSVKTFPPEKRERLVYIFYAKRAAFLFYYVLGTAVALIGVIFMVTTAYGIVASTLLSWYLGLGAMFGGSALIILAEVKKRYRLYILTTWNVRVRTGVVNRKTERVFYDQIVKVEATSDREEELAEMGDVCIYKDEDQPPSLVFTGIHNPDGVVEIIRRFVQTVKDPPDWDHIER
ncbi:MAG: hypothetical protein ACP6KW_09475 [Candidatus Thorarchaeota archaeon]